MSEFRLEEMPFDASEFRRDGCDAEDCGCYPHYGVAPHDCFWRIGKPFGESRVHPRSSWPANFIEDPDVPGLGTYLCPSCMRSLEDGR